MSTKNGTQLGVFTNYAREIEQHWKLKEKQRREYKFTSPQLPFRVMLVEWLKNVCEKIKVSYRTVHLAVYILDMFMDKHCIEKDRLGFVALVCLMLAAKFEEIDSKIPKISQLNKFDGFRYSHKDFIKIEVMILKFLDFGLAQPTVAHFAEYYAMFTVTSYDLKNVNVSQQYLASLSNSSIAQFLDICLREVKFVLYPPSQVAAACVLAARKQLELYPIWTPVLADITGYPEETLITCVTLLMKEVEDVSRRKTTFESPDHGYMSDAV